MKGSWNAELYGPLKDAAQAQPLDDNILVAKDRVSGFWKGDTEFARELAKRGIKTLLFAGVNTNQCVLGTLLDAYFRGFDCVLLDDCCATTTPGAKEVVGLDVSVRLCCSLFCLRCGIRHAMLWSGSLCMLTCGQLTSGCTGL